MTYEDWVKFQEYYSLDETEMGEVGALLEELWTRRPYLSDDFVKSIETEAKGLLDGYLTDYEELEYLG